jgi:phosphoesterase RecJ-like protein
MENNNQLTALREHIEKVDNILITSHVSPDPDSVCSILLLGLTLEKNYPDKKITMVSEEAANYLKFLSGYNKIKIQRLPESINNQELIIIVDAMNFSRCTRGDYRQLEQEIESKKIPIAIIDHHEPVGVAQNASYINNDNSSATQEVYELLYKDLSLQKPDGYADIALTGIYSDTAGFTYLKDNFQDTLNIAGEVMAAGASLQVIKTKLNQYSLDDLKAIREILNNIKVEEEYVFAFLGDDFVGKWLASGKDISSLNMAKSYFMDNFSRNIEGREWGFALYKEPLLGDDHYSISFRAINGVKDVSSLANKLNGGGHKAAAGAKVEAQNVDEAIRKIQEVIVSSL